MTAQMPLPVLAAEAVPIGDAAGLMEGATGGVVFLHGNAIFAWDDADLGARRWAAVQLTRIGAAKRIAISANVAPASSRPRICATTAAVSLAARFGPGSTGATPASPAASTTRPQPPCGAVGRYGLG